MVYERHIRRCAWIAFLFLVGLAQKVIAQDVVVTLATDSLGRIAFRVFNNTQRELAVHLDYWKRCKSGDQSNEAQTSWVRARDSDVVTPYFCAPMPAGDGSNDVMAARLLNYRWQLSPGEIAIDQAKAEAQELRDREERLRRAAEEENQRNQRQQTQRRLAMCHIDVAGRFENEKVAYGRIPSQCYEWFPDLKVMAERAKNEERERLDAYQRRQQALKRENELAAERKWVEAGTQKMLEQRQAELLAEQRKQEEERRRQEAARIAQERAEREKTELEADAQRLRNDPCGSAADLRARPPTQRAYPANENAQQRAGIDRYNQQLIAQWQTAVNERGLACTAATQRTRAAAVPASNRPPQPLRANTGSLDAAVARNQGVVQEEEARNRAMQDSNAELQRLLQGGR